jgi:hypothetical protein
VPGDLVGVLAEPVRLGDVDDVDAFVVGGHD